MGKPPLDQALDAVSRMKGERSDADGLRPISDEAFTHFRTISPHAWRYARLVGLLDESSEPQAVADRIAYPAQACSGRFDLDEGALLIAHWSGHNPEHCREVLDFLKFV